MPPDPIAPAPGTPLADSFGRQHTYLRLAVNEQCNLRCAYCMPEEGIALTPRDGLLTAGEIERLAGLFVRLGVEKIRLTGGEPLLRPDVVDVAARLGRLPGLGTLALTTNGLLLGRKLDALLAAGVSAVNLSLDTLQPERFRRIARRDGLECVLEALDALLGAPLASVKLNCVVLRGVNDDEVQDFAALAERHPLEVRFIEYMPFAGNGWQAGQYVPSAELLARVRGTWPALAARADRQDATSRTWSAPGWAGSIGFIGTLSEPFCEGCTRLRLTADGNLKVCLFGRTETNLRDLLRRGAPDEELALHIASAVRAKARAHDGRDLHGARVQPMHGGDGATGRPMIRIGG